MRILLSTLILLTSFTVSAQITDVLDSAAKTARTVAGTEAAIGSVADSPENIKDTASTGNKRKTATSLTRTARNVEGAAAGIGALTNSNIDVSGVSSTLREGAEILRSQANTESAADATIRSADRLADAVQEGNLNRTASAVRSIGSNAQRTVRNFNKWTGGVGGMEGMKELRANLNGLSTRLRGASQVQRSAQRVSRSANKIQEGIKSGNLSQVASGLKSMSSSIKSGEKGASKAMTGSNKSPSSSKKSAGSSKGSGKSGGSTSQRTGATGPSGGAAASAPPASSPAAPTQQPKQPKQDKPTSSKGSGMRAGRNFKKTTYKTQSDTLNTVLKQSELNSKEAKAGVDAKIKETFHKK